MIGMMLHQPVQAALPYYVQKAIIQVEGSDFINDTKDPGGPTKYGWTLNTYRKIVNKNANIHTIENLTQSYAMRLYNVYFWDKYGANKISNSDLATTLILAQINLGAKRPNIVIQRMSNEFCPIYKYVKDERIYEPLKEDGVLGKESIYRINHCKYLWPGYPYVLYYFYATSPHIADVWRWAKKGLSNRIFYGLHTRIK